MFKEYKYYLFLILFVGFLLHLAAVNYALPLRFFSDEYIHVANGLKMLEQKTLFLNFSYLPSLFAYLLMPLIVIYGIIGILLGVFNNLDGFREVIILHSEDLLIFSRFLAIVFSTLSVYLVYKLAKEFFNAQTGIIAAIILTLLPLHLQESGAGRFWLPLSFFMMATCYCLYKLVFTGQAKWYYWSVLFMALGFGMGLVAIILLPWLILAHYFFIKKTKKSFLNKDFIFSFVLLGLFVIIFVFSNTYTIFRQFGRGLGTILDIVGVGLDVPQSSPHFLKNNFFTVIWQVFEVIWANFYLLIIPLVVGIYYLAKNRQSWKNFTNFLLLILPIIYLIGLAFVFNGILNRYTLPALFFLVPVAAFGFKQLLENLQLNKLTVIVLLMVFLITQLYFSYGYTLLLLRTNTLIQTKEWVESNLTTNSRIIIDECPLLYLTANKPSLELQRENNSIFFDTRSKLLMQLTPEKYPQPNYFIYNFSHLDIEKIEKEELQANYYIVCYWNKIETASETKQNLLAKFNQRLIMKFYPIKSKYQNKEIVPLHNVTVGGLKYLSYLERLGPRVEIYQLVKK